MPYKNPEDRRWYNLYYRRTHHKQLIEYANSEGRRLYSKEWQAQNREKLLAYQRAYYQAHRVQQRAMQKLNYHVNNGDIIKPDRCELCDRKPRRLFAHHADYAHALSVKWLCGSCHRLAHSPFHA